MTEFDKTEYDFSTETERLKLLKPRQKMQIRIRNLKRPQPLLIFLVAVVLFEGFMLVGQRKTGKSTPVIKEEADTSLVMDFTGDTMLGRYIQMEGREEGYASVFQGVEGIFEKADKVFTNYESALLVNDENTYKEENRTINLSSETEALQSAEEAGIDVFSFANNHVMDYGQDALADMQEYLEENNVAYAGIHKDETEQAEEEDKGYIITEADGLKIAFAAFTNIQAERDAETLYTLSYDRCNEVVNQASKEADLTVVYCHWGNEGTTSITDTQREYAHQLVDAGADIVIGSHPHVLQGAESYENGMIFYSLGNFVFDQNLTFEKDSVIIQFVKEADGSCSYKLLPVRIDQGSPHVTDNAFYKWRINKTVSKGLDESLLETDSDGYLVVKTGQKIFTDTSQNSGIFDAAQTENSASENGENAAINSAENGGGGELSQTATAATSEDTAAGTTDVRDASTGMAAGSADGTTTAQMKASLVFDGCSEALYESIYPQMKERGLTGLIVFKEDRMPGIGQYLSKEHFQELLANGWQVAIGSKINKTNRTWEDQTQYLLQQVRTYGTEAVAYVCDDGSLNENQMQYLHNNGIDMVYTWENSGTTAVREITLLPYKSDQPWLQTIENKEYAFMVTINPATWTDAARYYDSVAFLALLDNKDIELCSVTD